MNTSQPPCFAATGFHVVPGVPGEEDSHIMMGRVEVTLRIDALLPLTEAGQCLLSMVNDFQSLLEKEEEEMSTAEFPVLKARYASPRKQPRGTSSVWAPQTSTWSEFSRGQLTPCSQHHYPHDFY